MNTPHPTHSEVQQAHFTSSAEDLVSRFSERMVPLEYIAGLIINGNTERGAALALAHGVMAACDDCSRLGEQVFQLTYELAEGSNG